MFQLPYSCPDVELKFGGGGGGGSKGAGSSAGIHCVPVMLIAIPIMDSSDGCGTALLLMLAGW